MSITEAAELARIILDYSEGERPEYLYTLTVHEARTLARAVIGQTAQLDAERFAHANTAVKVKRMKALAKSLDASALQALNHPGMDDDLKAHAHADRGLAAQIRTILNGETP